MLSAVNELRHADCVSALRELPAGFVDLVFADPPFNIGYEYDVYKDTRDRESYLAWSRDWISEVYRVLKTTGTFWLAIGDEYAAELKLASQEFGFACRSWVIWYYTFGVNCSRKFNRSHAHLLHFVKHPAEFTFNDGAIRVPSARQLVYADSRANPEGRLPDDTWILRPQDLIDGFTPDEDTWYFPRVAGTFKERAGFHGCQMPEQLLGRIIRCCSNPDDVVLDPFAGSATTLAVAKKLGRQWLGFELSKEYVKRGRARLEAACKDDPLEGSPEPTISAPPTRVASNGRNAKKRPVERRDRRLQAEAPLFRPGESVGRQLSEFEEGLIEAFRRTNSGFSTDRTVADPDINGAFVDACEKLGVPGTPADVNRSLFRLRKAGKLAHIPTSRRTEFDWRACDRYIFASEIALRRMLDLGSTSLDEVLCAPEQARQFDQFAAMFAPGFTPLEYRWAALKLRKEAKYARRRSEHVGVLRLSKPKPVSTIDWRLNPAVPGIYLLCAGARKVLYAGEAIDLRDRFGRHFGDEESRGRWLSYTRDLQLRFAPLPKSLAKSPVSRTNQLAGVLFAHQSKLIGQFAPELNFPHLAIA